MFMLLLVLAAQSGEDVYRVSDRESFLAAIGPDRTIVIEQGAKIVLSILEDFPEPPEFPHVSWNPSFDGSSLVIQNLNDLIITGEGSRESSLMAEPRYVFVLEFQNCTGVTLRNLQLGHTTGGYCDSGVLGMSGCSDLTVDDCLLYGCGTEGLTVSTSQGLVVTSSDIVECTYGIMTCRDSEDLLFQDCVFRDNEEFYGVELFNCSGVNFSGCLFRNNYCYFTPGFMNNQSADPVRIEFSTFDSITCPLLFNGENFHLEDNEFLNVTETD